MKTYIKLILTSALLLSVGCAVSQKLPSLTVGGAANKHEAVGASVNKEGLSVTAPLVNLKIPAPNVDINKK